VIEQDKEQEFIDKLQIMSGLAKDRGFAVTLFQSNFRNPKILSAVTQARPRFVEYWPRISAQGESPSLEDLQSGGQGYSELETDIWCRNAIKHLRSHSKIIMRMFRHEHSQWSSLIDAYALKSLHSAGRYGFHNNEEMLLAFADCGKPLIPQGGIGTPAQVRSLLSAGAAAVGIGTVFAASKESCLSQEAKAKIIHSSSKDLVKLDSRQQALAIGDLPEFTPDDWNRHNSLMDGITTGQSGHVYMGTAIDHINEILSVKEIVEYLVGEL
jgi:hypothetical protein